MTFKEKMAWVNALVTVAVGAVYFAVVGARLDGGPVSEIDYKWWMIGTIGVTIVATIIGTIVMAIGTAIRAERARSRRSTARMNATSVSTGGASS
jgi:Kef-type K+ transport system membrane component KefB